MKHRADIVVRVLKGEDLEKVAAELNVSARNIEKWSKEFCRAGEMRLRQMPDNLLERCLSSTEKLVPLATLVSVLLAVTLFIQGQRKEASLQARTAVQARESRVRDAYAALDDKYLDYVKVCLDHPDLDVFDKAIVNPSLRSSDQMRRESMILSMLLSILERAYLMYSNPNDDFERNQWVAWSEYIKMWSTRTNFRIEWSHSRKEYDSNFVKFVDVLMQRTPTQIETDDHP